MAGNEKYKVVLYKTHFYNKIASFMWCGNISGRGGKGGGASGVQIPNSPCTTGTVCNVPA